jgi:hypothetical protein
MPVSVNVFYFLALFARAAHARNTSACSAGGESARFIEIIKQGIILDKLFRVARLPALAHGNIKHCVLACGLCTVFIYTLSADFANSPGSRDLGPLSTLQSLYKCRARLRST